MTHLTSKREYFGDYINNSYEWINDLGHLLNLGKIGLYCVRLRALYT